MWTARFPCSFKRPIQAEPNFPFLAFVGRAANPRAECRLTICQRSLQTVELSASDVFKAPPIEWVTERLGKLQEPLERDTPRSALLLRRILGPIRLVPITPQVGKPYYQSETTLQRQVSLLVQIGSPQSPISTVLTFDVDLIVGIDTGCHQESASPRGISEPCRLESLELLQESEWEFPGECHRLTSPRRSHRRRRPCRLLYDLVRSDKRSFQHHDGGSGLLRHHLHRSRCADVEKTIQHHAVREPRRCSGSLGNYRLVRSPLKRKCEFTSRTRR